MIYRFGTTASLSLGHFLLAAGNLPARKSAPNQTPTFITVKCKGKGKAFEKPGPSSRFVMASRHEAQAHEALALETHEAALADLFKIIEEHPVPAWINRARIAIIPFLAAARQGKSVLQVPADCDGCLRHEHTHSAFCRLNQKKKERDTKVMGKVKHRLNAIAFAAREALAQSPVAQLLSVGL